MATNVATLAPGTDMTEVSVTNHGDGGDTAGETAAKAGTPEAMPRVAERLARATGPRTATGPATTDTAAPAPGR